MEFVIIGLVSAINLIIITHKFKKGRVEDGIFDSLLFVLLATMFSGSYGGMVVAMIASLVISIYLLASPPKFFKSFMASKEVKGALKDLKSFTKPNDYKENIKKAEDLKFD